MNVHRPPIFTQIVVQPSCPGGLDLLRDLGEFHHMQSLVIIGGHRIHANHHLHFPFAFKEILEKVSDAAVAIGHLMQMSSREMESKRRGIGARHAVNTQ